MAGTIIGLKNLYYAILTTDTASALTYETPVRIVGAIEAKINPNASMDTLFADDGPMDTISTLGKIEVEIKQSDLPMNVLAALLGHAITSGVLIKKSSDVPPWVAIGFQSLKSNGYYKYIWLTKGKFSVPEQSFETKGESINFQPPSIKGNFVKREFDQEWMRETEEDYVDYTASIGTNWFASVDGTGTVDTVAPTVTVVPADEAGSIAINASVVWTFNEAIKSSCVTAGNFFLLAGGAPIAGALSIDTTKKIVTFDPTANLANSVEHTAIVTTGVQDLAGNALAAESITTFTTVGL